MAKQKKVAKVTHYYANIGVAVVKTTAPFKIGDKVHFKGHTTDFEQEVQSLQFDHKTIDEVKKGDEVGIEVKERVREGDEVLLAEG